MSKMPQQNQKGKTTKGNETRPAQTMQKRGEWRHYKPHRAQIFLPLTEWEIK